MYSVGNFQAGLHRVMIADGSDTARRLSVRRKRTAITLRSRAGMTSVAARPFDHPLTPLNSPFAMQSVWFEG